MFYQENALRRGGKFYMCWVADSWPGRFKKLTFRQLWSQDIRIICEDLMEVITKESRRPDARFSLRLSSQLMRGLVRLYHAQTTSLLGTLCMLNANVIKAIHQKWSKEERRPTAGVRRPKRPRITEVVPDNEERVEERVQNSGHGVTHIEDITLREPVIPELQLPVDGFGEENPDQALALLNDRTLEHMLGAEAMQSGHSGLGVSLATLGADRSVDPSRLMPPDIHMERASDHDISVFRKSTAAELLPDLGDISKDIPIPEIPPPAIPIPSPEQLREKPGIIEEQENVPDAANEPIVPTELEELSEVAQEPKRRRVRRLVVDRRTKIPGAVFRQRLDQVRLELRCQNSSEDRINPLWVQWSEYFIRPAHVRSRLAAFGSPLAALFLRNLGVIGRVEKDPLIEKMLTNSAMRHLTARSASRKALEPIPEQDAEPSEPPRQSEDAQLELADLPTQLLPTDKTPPTPRKRSATAEKASPAAKKQCASGFVSFNMSRKSDNFEPPTGVPELEIEPPIEQEKRKSISDEEVMPAPTNEKQMSHMLQAAGLADAPATAPGKNGSSEGSSEAPLGSLDKTAVDLGESVRSTDTQNFLRCEWGTQGTMRRVVHWLASGRERPLTVAALVREAPLPTGARPAFVAAKCFSSLLKLKQNGFVNLEKDPVTLAITNISYGPKMID